MAKVIKRHWRLFLLQAFLVFGSALLLAHHLLKSPGPAAAAMATPTPPAAAAAPPVSLDPVLWTRVQSARRQLAMTDEELAAAGCTQGQATAVLQSLLNWYPANAASWDQLEAAKATAQSQLNEAVRKMNVGPPDPVLLASLPSLQQSLSSTSGQFDQLIQSASVSATALLSSSQQQMLTTARANAGFGLPSPYRFAAGLTADQARAFKLAVYHHRQSGDPAFPSAVVSAGQAVAPTMSQNMPGVLAAEAAVLPTPTQLSVSAKAVSPQSP